MKSDKDFNNFSRFIDLVYSEDESVNTVITFSHCGRDLKMMDAICKFVSQIEDIDYLQFRIKYNDGQESISWIDLGEDRDFLDGQLSDNTVIFDVDYEKKQDNNELD